MKPDEKKADQSGVHEPETTPAQERGERIDTGKSIARGGKEDGRVPGAEPTHTSEGDEQSRKRTAVADALKHLGQQADPAAVVAAVKMRDDIDLSPEEVTAIRRELERG